MNYETPSQEIFDEIKKEAIKIWETYDDTYGYVTEKKKYVDSIENYEDNAMAFYRMFDFINRGKLINNLSDKAIYYINNNQ